MQRHTWDGHTGESATREMRPEVVEDLKQNIYTDDTRDEVLDVIQVQRELRNSYPGDGRWVKIEYSCNFGRNFALFRGKI